MCCRCRNQFTLLTTLAAPFFQIYTLTPCPTPLRIASACIQPGSFFDGWVRCPRIPKNCVQLISIRTQTQLRAQWNLNVQYQLTSSLTSMVAYVGSRGIHQPLPCG